MPCHASSLVVIVGYSLLTWTGMALFGVETWRAKADPFARFFGLFARFAPFRGTRRGSSSVHSALAFGEETPPSCATVALSFSRSRPSPSTGSPRRRFGRASSAKPWACSTAPGFVEAFGYGAAAL